MKASERFKNTLFSNTSYKLMSLLAAIMLWLLILGRTDALVTRGYSLDFLVPEDHLVTKNIERVEVKLSGPRMALKKLAFSDKNVVLDVRDMGQGRHRVKIEQQDISDLPVGVKVISIQPRYARIKVTHESSEAEQGGPKK